jgi:hypothetical protein
VVCNRLVGSKKREYAWSGSTALMRFVVEEGHNALTHQGSNLLRLVAQALGVVVMFDVDPQLLGYRRVANGRASREIRVV